MTYRLELQTDGTWLAHGPRNPITVARMACQAAGAPFDPASFDAAEARIGDQLDLPGRFIRTWDDLSQLLSEVGVVLVLRWGVLYCEAATLH